MGLDMYLNKKYYVQNWEHTTPEEKHTITIMKGDKPSLIPTDKITYIETEEIYWRKANAIHKWFVDNVQDGNDDCGEYYVDKEQLKQLLDICDTIIKSSKLVKGKVYNGYSIKNGIKEEHYEDGELIQNYEFAEKLLPTQSGFFFGGTNYDQYYFDDIKYTYKELTRLLSQPEDYGSFYYHSSW